MINFEIAQVVLSGSFRRDVDGLQIAYDELISTGCHVLSPHRLDFNNSEEFVRDIEELTLGVKEIEMHHLVAIRQADFLWLHAADGYIGKSAAFELGYACALQKPIFSRSYVKDVMLRQFIIQVASVYDAKRLLRV